MNKLHEFVHAYDTVRHYNKAVDGAELSISLCQGKWLDNTTIDMPFEEAKSTIQDVCQKNIDRYSSIYRFVANNDDYDLTKYTDESFDNILSYKTVSDTLNNSLLLQVANKKDFVELAKISDICTLQYAYPISLIQSYHYAIIMADWLDAIYYICCGIDFNTGAARVYPEKEISKLITGMLGQFNNLSAYWPDEIYEDVRQMLDCRSWVSSHIGDWESIRLYLENYNRLPLFRRLWAIDNGY